MTVHPAPFRFLYQDESGDPCRAAGDFMVGLLLVRDREPIRNAVQHVREEMAFSNELHFSQMSPLRERVYCRVSEELANVREQFEFRAVLLRRGKLDLTLCGGKRHLAYNFFTRLLVQKNASGIGCAVMYSDQKARMKEDNFLEYLRAEVNLEAGRCVLKKVEPMDSKKDSLLQVADLLIGCASNLMGHPAGERKARVREVAHKLGLISSGCVWDWMP